MQAFGIDSAVYDDILCPDGHVEPAADYWETLEDWRTSQLAQIREFATAQQTSPMRTPHARRT